MAKCEEAPEALKDQLDVARGLENLPVSAWPPGAEPEPFQVGAGLDWPESCARPPRAWPASFLWGGARRSRALLTQRRGPDWRLSRKRASRVGGRCARFAIT